jgi:hypothetical protein
MHPTPLRVDKIIAILKAGACLIAFLIYHGGADDGQPVGRQSTSAISKVYNQETVKWQRSTNSPLGSPVG